MYTNYNDINADASYVDEQALAQYDEAYEATELEERDYGMVPDGKYQVNIEKAELRRGAKITSVFGIQSSGHLWSQLNHEILNVGMATPADSFIRINQI